MAVNDTGLLQALQGCKRSGIQARSVKGNVLAEELEVRKRSLINYCCATFFPNNECQWDAPNLERRLEKSKHSSQNWYKLKSGEDELTSISEPDEKLQKGNERP